MNIYPGILFTIARQFKFNNILLNPTYMFFLIATTKVYGDHNAHHNEYNDYHNRDNKYYAIS